MADVRLGLNVKMPPGYEIVRVDDHFIWTLNNTLESPIHWDKWAIYRGAWAHYRRVGNAGAVPADAATDTDSLEPAGRGQKA